MELLRDVVVLLHIVGFAVTFGAWVTEAVSRRFRTTRTMNYGVLVSLITGVVLGEQWPAGVVLNYPKLWTKFGILLVLGAVLGIASARQRRTGNAAPRLLFVAVGVLSLAAAAIAVLW